MASDMQLHLLTAILQRGRPMDRASGILTLIGLAIGLAPLFGAATHPLGRSLALVLLLAGGIQKYWALRVGIDAHLFVVLADRHADTFDVRARELDDALHQLGLAPTPEDFRSVAERGQGALRLLRWQAACLLVQCVSTLTACVALLWLD